MKVTVLDNKTKEKVNRWAVYFADDKGADMVAIYRTTYSKTPEHAIDRAIANKPGLLTRMNYHTAYVTGLLTHAETKPVFSKSIK